MIPCKLVPMKYSYSNNETDRTKYGLYTGSNYPIKGYGRTRWIVIVNIEIDYEHYIEKGLTEEEIVLGCIKYLNHPPKSKYGKKRRRKPVYGTFNPSPQSFKLREQDGKKIIQTLLITKTHKNKNFWGEGRKDPYSLCQKKK